MAKSRSLLVLKCLAGASWIILLLASATGYGQEYHPLTHRQYSDVTGGPEWLARPEREKEEQPEKALDAIGVEKGSTVADIGCANGYMTAKLARRVGPMGTVYGEDIQSDMLTLMMRSMKEQGLNNVHSVLGSPTDPRLPKESVDLIMLVDVYHEFQNPREMLRGIKDALKPNGRLVLLEYRAEDKDLEIRELHKMTVAQTRAEIEPEGFRFDKAIEVLPEQHIIIYRK